MRWAWSTTWSLPSRCCRGRSNARAPWPPLPGAALRTTKQRFRERTQAGFDDACSAGIRYQLECYSTGEPQRVMREFLARRDAPKTSNPPRIDPR